MSAKFPGGGGYDHLADSLILPGLVISLVVDDIDNALSLLSKGSPNVLPHLLSDGLDLRLKLGLARPLYILPSSALGMFLDKNGLKVNG